ncbi:glycosyltransferase family 4 protein [Psychroserpens jangbogonensis]|uniref:glycosyltransferase family 4 protein n=1 Tax=Psychroserpens jangbogonensis TaxID=1484460 RepID=UPI00053E7AE1|nr:glycosyltransferase family 4 protein [Psychroserpens jangbogonensis]
MHPERHNKPTIGLVLSTVPRYSETFFRNKIIGLQNNGFDVVLFVDYIEEGDLNFPCSIVAAPDFGGNLLKLFLNSCSSIIKSLFLHPKKSFKLYLLDKRDGLSFKKRMRNLIVNQFLLAKTIDWLHFGFGMLSNNRENVAQAIGAKMAVSFRGFDLYLSPLKHENCYDKLFLKDVKYHLLSQEMKEDLIDNKISAYKIKVIPPAINIDFFQSKGNHTENKVVKIITIARLHWKKGIEYTLEAIHELKQNEINFHYTIIGDGSQLERLVFAAHQLGIQDCITFTGKMSQVEVKKQLEESDVYLQYSIQEGFCNAVLEAQAMGLMCIVSNAEGLSENVLNGKTGWVVPKRQPKLLAQKIIEVINLSSNERESIRETAISRVREEFNLQKQNKSFENFYEN